MLSIKMTFQTNKRVTILYSTPMLEVEFNTPTT